MENFVLKRRVVVTGLGLITPVGNTVETTWAALKEGRSGADYIQKFDAEKFPVRFACEVRDFDPLNYVEKKEARKMGAFIQYAIAASQEAVTDSGLKITDDVAEGVGTYISSGIGDFWAIEREHEKLLKDGPGRISPFFIPSAIVNLASGQVSIRHNAKGPNSATATACSAGAHAIGDSFRIIQARRIYQVGLRFPRELQSQVDWLVLWRRIGGGLSSAHQQELRNYLGDLGIGRKKPGTRLNSQLEHDGWRLLASLEHLSGATRAALGSELLRKLRREPTDSGWLWSLGRFGVRIPLYGALSCVIPAETAADWITALLDLRELTHETASAVVQLGRRVDHRTRDIGRDVVRSAIAELTSAGVADDIFLRPLHEYIAPGRADVVRTFGEPLPKGLELESTANCLSSITALTS